MYKILKNIIEMDDYSVQKLSKSQPPEPFQWNTVEGTELNVDDCVGGKGKIEVKGNTYQKQLSGKNKFGVSERSEVVADVDCLFKDSEILINGAQTTGKSSSKLTFKDILPAGTYHIKPKVISGTYVNDSGSHALSIVITYTNNTKLVDKWLDGLDMDFTLSEANQLKFSIWIPAGAQFNNYKVGIQIEEGSTATDYEPYCGGQASPNPLYPQNIEVVTGNNIIKNLGKNLLPCRNSDSSKNGLSWKINSDGSILINGTATAQTVIPINTDTPNINPDIKLKDNTEYTISGGINGTSSTFGLQCGYKIAGSPTAWSEVFNNKKISTTKDWTLGVGVIIRKGITMNNVLIKPMIEEGTIPTSYEPYREEDYNLNLGNIELCKNRQLRRHTIQKCSRR